MQLFPLMYLGAKHMVTGYDHLLFRAGVIFVLYRLKDVALYVTLFAVGHIVTLLAGMLGGIRADPHIVDAIIGLSVVYKALENIGAFERLGMRIDSRAAVFAFGLAHGFGLATKPQDLPISADGLVGNRLWRRSERFQRSAYHADALIMTAGWTLFGL